MQGTGDAGKRNYEGRQAARRIAKIADIAKQSKLGRQALAFQFGFFGNFGIAGNSVFEDFFAGHARFLAS